MEFLFLSRHIPKEDKEGRKLRNSNKHVHQKLFKDLYKALTGRDPFSQMLRKYLEDIHVTYHEQRPDSKTLEYVTLQLLGLGGPRVSEKSVPEFFSVIFDDLAAISQWVQGANKNLFKQGLRRQFYTEPLYDVRTLRDDIAANSGKMREGNLSKYCNGGKVNFCARGYLTNKSTKLLLEFGIWINASKSQRKKKVSRSDGGIYANLSWKPWKQSDEVERFVFLSKFPDEEHFQNELREVLKKTKAAALKKSPKPEKRLMLNFRVP